MVQSSVLLVLLQLCSLQLMAVAMPTCRLDGGLVQRAHRLLRDLAGDFPSHCLDLNTNVSFPDSALPAATANQPQCQRALWVVYASLEEAELLFDDEELPVGVGGANWDEQEMKTFRLVQGRVVEEGGCLSPVEDSGVLSSYFSNVTSVLQQQDTAACGWMALRRDLLWVLLTAPIRHKHCFSWRSRTTPLG